ncbi:hypothetical protein TSOC_013235 [Tetrabaena socialis]|uniref:Peptidase S74 domain-containing protein n=1 Tax=Tetrabaena socialis TaxID=47790 RepID=A0A2J7ZKW9_9CHLO|nr:hypothetical protein TSOC_013235 [Tetrabaena socialis]|eukprot:PNH00918.1 hypothetical protein TSOC_013235 [Tetrabaena socialis]
MAFNAATFMYLNPQLTYCNVQTTQQATNVYQTWGSQLPTELPPPPADFSADGYIILHRDRIDIAGINDAIKASLAADGVLDTRSGQYLPTILQPMTAIASNAFQTSCNVTLSQYIRTGDYVKLTSSNAQRASDVLLTRVTSLAGNVLTVSDAMRNSNVPYTLVGPELADPKRLAFVDVARVNLTSTSNLYPPDNIRTFDSYLYKTLYYDAQALTSYEAYLDYVSRRTSGDYRVRTGDDVISALTFQTGLTSGLAVGTRFELLPGTPFIMTGASISRISSDSGQLPTESNLPSQMACILTEAGMKKYMELRLLSTVENYKIVYTSNNDLSIQGAVAMASNLTVMGTVTMASNLAVTGTVTIGTATLQSSSGTLRVTGVDDVQCAGSVTAKSFKALSDRRVKADIRKDTRRQQQEDLRKLMRVHVARYRFTDEKESKRKGVIAQELSKHFPDAVEDVLRPQHLEPRTVERRASTHELLIRPDERNGIVTRGSLIAINGGDFELVVSVTPTASGTLVRLGTPVLHDIEEIAVMQRVKVVDYEYLMMTMLNAIKVMRSKTKKSQQFRA